MRQSAFWNGYWCGRYLERAVAVGRLAASHCLTSSNYAAEVLILGRVAMRAVGEIPLASSTGGIQREHLCRQMLFAREVPSSVENSLEYAYRDASLVRELLTDHQWIAVRDAREAITLAAGNFRRDAIAEAVDFIYEKVCLVAYEADMGILEGYLGTAIALGIYIERIYQTMFVVRAWSVTLQEEPAFAEDAGHFALAACSAELAYRQHLSFTKRPNTDPLAFLLHERGYRRSVVSSLQAVAREIERLQFAPSEKSAHARYFCNKIESIMAAISLWPMRNESNDAIMLLDEFCAEAEAVFYRWH